MARGCWWLPWVLWSCATTAQAAPRRPSAAHDLSLEVVTAEPSAQKASSRRAQPSGASLVLNSLSEEERTKLAQSLQSLVAALARKRNPFYIAIDDTEEHATAQKLFAETAPAFTAALALSRGRWQSSEGDLAVQVVETCSRGSRCIPLFSQSQGDGLEQRIRFLAWPVGYAVVLRSSATSAAQVATILRASPPSSLIGLVLTSDELHSLRKSPALDLLLKSAGHLANRLPGSQLLETLESIRRAASARDEAPWLKLPRDTVLVIPRLSALATKGRFVDEVKTRLEAIRAAVDWLSFPQKPTTGLN
jgi:hypothetical protein